MGTEVRAVPETAPLDPAETSIGRYLARQRELRGISLDELAARTKIPLRSLARLESGAFDAKPDGFARGFVRTVALALGLDADEAVTRLLAEPVADVSSPAGASRPMLAIAAAALLALVAAGVVWRSGSSRETAPARAPAPNPEWVLRHDAVRSLAAGDAVPIQSSERSLPKAAPVKPAKAPSPKLEARSVAATPTAIEPAPAPAAVAPAASEPAAEPSTEATAEATIAAAPEPVSPESAVVLEDGPTPPAAAQPEGASAAAEVGSAAEVAVSLVDPAPPPPSTATEPEAEPSPAAAAPSEASDPQAEEIGAPGTP